MIRLKWQVKKINDGLKWQERMDEVGALLNTASFINPFGINIKMKGSYV